MMKYELVHGDCLEVLRKMEDNSVDAIVTDPPYGLSFMGKRWDYEVPSVEMWKECFRALKPGGHLLSFAGSRTYHRMAVNIEDAGFEIRDQIMWVYGSGFPKSQSVSKNIDKKEGCYVEGEVLPSSRKVKGPLGFNMKEKTGENPQTDEAKQWQGWGSALKPAHEPIVVARKPIIGTIVENVLEHGTGALNIDACRIEHNDPMITRKDFESNTGDIFQRAKGDAAGPSPKGRFPSNFIHDGSEEVVSLFPDSSRFFYCAKASKAEREAGLEGFEQIKNHHPTVKPIDLMRYLCRLITPPSGVVLDPFMGSGTTGIGATAEGFSFIGIEREEEYINIARHRISHWVKEKEEQVRQQRAQKSLFDW